MKAQGYLDAKDYGRNFHRTKMQLSVLAKDYGWLEDHDSPGRFYPDPDYKRPKKRFKTMAD